MSCQALKIRICSGLVSTMQDWNVSMLWQFLPAFANVLRSLVNLCYIVFNDSRSFFRSEDLPSFTKWYQVTKYFKSNYLTFLLSWFPIFFSFSPCFSFPIHYLSLLSQSNYNSIILILHVHPPWTLWICSIGVATD